MKAAAALLSGAGVPVRRRLSVGVRSSSIAGPLRVPPDGRCEASRVLARLLWHQMWILFQRQRDHLCLLTGELLVESLRDPRLLDTRGDCRHAFVEIPPRLDRITPYFRRQLGAACSAEDQCARVVRAGRNDRVASAAGSGVKPAACVTNVISSAQPTRTTSFEV